ncbi:MAG: DUF1549 domain-containing protein, partial [Planctomycetes bacterium]|nr:DUF1549 domain-containing protein [Planctomycetota bacterium]
MNSTGIFAARPVSGCRVGWFGDRTLFVLLVAVALGSGNSAPAQVDFSREIQPILSNRCFKCHGPDEQAREADLRLDTAEEATADRGGYQAIAPGEPESSAVIERIEASDADLRMPPADSGLKLEPEQIALVRQWIREGATYEQHWAFRPIRRPALPTVSSDWVRNPIDVFIAARQRMAGIEPSPEADRSTLIRRVYLDLLGLPPDPEQVDRYVSDSGPNAYERMVDGVLASPRYGERWGRHWLDQARYADTNGYTVDSERSIWPYRDWVIAALNHDLPFDRFTIEQLAGDLLPQPTQDQLIATGFHRNTLVNQEGGADPEQFRNEAVMDRVKTTGAVWLGLTIGCAQCHNHKFDPISVQEYYQLFAFFNSSRDVNSVSPTIQVADDDQVRQLQELDRRIAAAKRDLAEYDRLKNQHLPSDEQADGTPIDWKVLKVVDFQSKAGASWERLDDDSIVLGGVNGEEDEYIIRATATGNGVTALRLETLTHPSLPNGGPGRAGNGNFVLNEVQLSLDGAPPVPWLHATADHSQKDYP